MCLIYLISFRLTLLTPWSEFSPRFLRCYLFLASFGVMLNPVRIVKIAKIANIVKMNFERVAKIPDLPITTKVQFDLCDKYNLFVEVSA